MESDCEQQSASLFLTPYFNMQQTLKNTLMQLAAEYENKDFIVGDPSWFMHQVEGAANKETLAFVAASLSYGSRKQFLPKIQALLDCSNGKVQSFYDWVKTGTFKADIPDDQNRCFYRLYTYATMHKMLCALQEMLLSYGTIKQYVKTHSNTEIMTCSEAVEVIVRYFSERGIEGIIPKNTKSSCKRICMFLRWMVRDASPVDIGLWSDIIDKRTLIIPMDTHVLQEANRLGLMSSKVASMSSAIKLTARLREVFPDDPLKGDFALFGVGIAK